MTDTVVVRGFGLFGVDHAVRVPVMNGHAVVPRRAKPPLCGKRRVMVTSEPFLAGDPGSCKICSSLTTEGTT